MFTIIKLKATFVLIVFWVNCHNNIHNCPFFPYNLLILLYVHITYAYSYHIAVVWNDLQAATIVQSTDSEISVKNQIEASLLAGFQVSISNCVAK